MTTTNRFESEAIHSNSEYSAPSPGHLHSRRAVARGKVAVPETSRNTDGASPQTCDGCASSELCTTGPILHAALTDVTQQSRAL